jgi:hypothetical protein
MAFGFLWRNRFEGSFHVLKDYAVFGRAQIMGITFGNLN